MRPAVSYIRVSTQKQGRSGLGLEAQAAAIAAFAASEGFTVIDSFVEIETGKGADALEQRPQLAAALELAQLVNGTVVVAKLDRLTRDVHFGSGLMAGKIPFRVAAMPHADNFQLHIMLAVAEKERQDISDRTKAALQAAKARGQQLGNPDIGKLRKAEAEERATHLRSIIEPLRNLSAKRISAVLNERKVAAPRGGRWQATQVIRLLNRIALTSLQHDQRRD
ncbi:recombinase family protein [Bradyrhizobium sp. McL0615]|uniref:recombinase family protein n=1 Tax=Bradyrhizobium sp. McL0615 TaxID=3415673 RepID=UPI003CF4DF1B